MNYYLKINIKDYDNFDEIIKINDKINELKKIISNNKNFVFEVNNNNNYDNNKYLNNDFNDNLKKKIDNITFYIKTDKNILGNSEKEINDKCYICHELLLIINTKTLICHHDICYSCFNKWNKICIDNLKITNCPICRKIITT